MTPTRQWDVSHSADDELRNALEHKSGLLPNERGIQFLDQIEELTKRFGVRCTVATDCRLTAKELSCRAR